MTFGRALSARVAKALMRRGGASALWLSVWVAATFSAQQGQAAEVFRFTIRADPPAIPANGRSTATISIEINSAPNLAALQGTPANFVTTLGVIEPFAPIAGNTARVTLRSGLEPGVAIVTAIVGQSREQVQVKFLPTDGTQLIETRSITFTGRNLAYYPDAGLIIASGKTHVKFRQVLLHANISLQFELKKEQLLMEGEPGANAVVISNGKRKIEGDRLKLFMKPLRGVMLKVNPQPERLYLSGDSLQIVAAESESNESVQQRRELDIMKFSDPPVFDQGTVVVARQIVIYPGEKIKFKRAQIYINGQHVITLPLHVLSLNNSAYDAYGIIGEQVFGFNSSGGFGLDFPFYYRVSSGGQGAIRLRHSGGDGFFADVPGWSLALEEEYSLGTGGEGTFVLDKIGNGNWGAQLNHTHDFNDRTSAYLYISSPYHTDTFIRSTFTSEHQNFTLGLEAYGNIPAEGYASGTAQVYIQTRTTALGKTGLDFSTSLEIGYSNNPDAEKPEVVSETLQVPLRFPTWQLAPQTSVALSLQPQLFHDNTGVINTGLGASLTLSHKFTPLTFASLTYTRSPGISSSSGVLNTQYISGSFCSTPSPRWNITAAGTYSLTDASIYGSLTADYRVNEKFRIGAISSYQRFTGESFTDYDIFIGRRLGRLKMEGLVGWSKSRGDIYLQVGNISF